MDTSGKNESILMAAKIIAKVIHWEWCKNGYTNNKRMQQTNTKNKTWRMEQTDTKGIQDYAWWIKTLFIENCARIVKNMISKCKLLTQKEYKTGLDE